MSEQTNPSWFNQSSYVNLNQSVHRPPTTGVTQRTPSLSIHQQKVARRQKFESQFRNNTQLPSIQPHAGRTDKPLDQHTQLPSIQPHVGRTDKPLDQHIILIQQGQRIYQTTAEDSVSDIQKRSGDAFQNLYLGQDLGFGYTTQLQCSENNSSTTPPVKSVDNIAQWPTRDSYNGEGWVIKTPAVDNKQQQVLHVIEDVQMEGVADSVGENKKLQDNQLVSEQTETSPISFVSLLSPTDANPNTPQKEKPQHSTTFVCLLSPADIHPNPPQKSPSKPNENPQNSPLILQEKPQHSSSFVSSLSPADVHSKSPSKPNENPQNSPLILQEKPQHSTSKTQASPSRTPTTQFVPSNQSRGKSIKLTDQPPLSGNFSSDGEFDDVSENESTYDDEEVSINDLNRIFFKEEKNTNEDYLVKKLESIDKIENSVLDVYKLTKERVKLLVEIGQYLDDKSGKTIFKRGFKWLIANEMPNIKKRWASIHNDSVSLNTVPSEFHWFFIQMFVCYAGYVEITKKNKSILTSSLATLIDKMDNFNPRNILSSLVSFNTTLSKKVRTTSSNKRGDLICENSNISVGDQDEPSAVLKTASSVVGNQGHAIVSSDSLFRPPSRVTSNKGKGAENHLKSTDSYKEMSSGNESDSKMGAKAKKRRANTTSDMEMTSGNDSDVGSCYSGSSIRSIGRKRLFNMEILAKSHPVTTARNNIRGNKQITNAYPTDTEHMSPQSNRGERHVNFRSSPMLLGSERSEDNFGPCKLSSAIIINSGVIEDCRISAKTIMSTLRPNLFITSALREVVIDILDETKQDPNMNVTFAGVLKGIVKKLTSSVLGHPTFDQQEIISSLAIGLDRTKQDAMVVCVSLLSLLYIKEQAIVSILWSDLKKWCVDFSKILNDQIIEIMSKRVEQKKIDLTDLKDEFIDFRNAVEARVSQKYQEVLPIFIKLSNINDMCLYTIFGINHFKQDTGGSMFTDTIVKTILLSWLATKHCPIDLSRSNGEELNNLFWCLPLAFLTKLRGVGTATVTKESPNMACSIEEFLDAGLLNYSKINPGYKTQNSTAQQPTPNSNPPPTSTPMTSTTAEHLIATILQKMSRHELNRIANDT